MSSFLLRIGGHHLFTLFRVEIRYTCSTPEVCINMYHLYSMGLLGEFLEVLNLCFVNEHTDAILGILKDLSKSSRFGLAMNFLGRSEKKAVSIDVEPL